MYFSIVGCELFPTLFTLTSNAAMPTLLHDPVHIHQSFCWIYTQKWNYWDLGIISWILLDAVNIAWKWVYHAVFPRLRREDTVTPTRWQLLKLSDLLVFANVSLKWKVSASCLFWFTFPCNWLSFFFLIQFPSLWLVCLHPLPIFLLLVFCLLICRNSFLHIQNNSNLHIIYKYCKYLLPVLGLYFKVVYE